MIYLFKKGKWLLLLVHLVRKSTLLRCLNLLEKPDNGIIKIAETELDVKQHSKKEELALRNQSAMVFQSYNLFKNKRIAFYFAQGRLKTCALQTCGLGLV